jgi:hypothetical protein
LLVVYGHFFYKDILKVAERKKRNTWRKKGVDEDDENCIEKLRS